MPACALWGSPRWRAGGAIALHAKRGYRMKIVCMSYGERGESQFAWKEAGATLEKVKAVILVML